MADKDKRSRAKQTDDHIKEPEFTVVHGEDKAFVFKGQALPYDPNDRSTIPAFARCPSCYPGLGGIGRRKWWRRASGVLVKRCYKCDRCGHEWTVDVRTNVPVEFMDTDVEYREPPPMETR